MKLLAITVVAVAALAVAFGATATTPETTQTAQAPSCCFQTKFSSGTAQKQGIVLSGGQVITQSAQGKFYFDVTKKAIAIVLAFTQDNTPNYKFNITVIQDFKQGVQYTVDKTRNTCQKTSLPSKYFTSCVPPNATFLGQHRFGSNLMANQYSYQLPAMNMDVNAFYEDKTCSPLVQSIQMTMNGMKMMISQVFYDGRPTIDDPTVFTPPAICNHKVAAVRSRRSADHFHFVNPFVFV